MSSAILFVLAILSALATHLLHIRYRQGPIRSSALVALSASLFFYLFPDLISRYLSQHIPLVAIGGSFIGMVTSDRLATRLGIGIAGAIFGLIYLHTSRYFDGYGGALGTSACISVLVAMSIPYLTSRRKLTVGILQLRRMLLQKKERRR